MEFVDLVVDHDFGGHFANHFLLQLLVRFDYVLNSGDVLVSLFFFATLRVVSLIRSKKAAGVSNTKGPLEFGLLTSGLSRKFPSGYSTKLFGSR